MGEKVLSKKRIIIYVSSLIVLLCLITSGIYLKRQNDIKNYKTFCNNYEQIDKKISENEKVYATYIKAMKNYVEVFTKYEGHAKLDDVDKGAIEQRSTEYIALIEELKKLTPPKEMQDDYRKIIDLYEKDSIRRESINRDIRNNNGRSTKSDVITDGNSDLIELKNDFQSKIAVISKQKGINLEE